MNNSSKRTNIFFIILALFIGVGAVLLNILATDDSAHKILGTIELDDGDEQIDWNRYEQFNITLDESLTIIRPGVYNLSGELADGMIKIEAGEGDVKLVLDNVRINNNTGPAIYCVSADDLVIELVGESYLSDGEEYDATLSDKVNAVIYSKDDLSFTGEGTLNIEANYQDGIASKDDLKINSGSFVISSVDDGIRGKDSVYIIDGNFNIEAGGNAIRSTNEDRSGKGFIYIKDGTLNLKSSKKGLVAYNSIYLFDGSYTISSLDDAIHSNNYVGIINGEYAISSSDDGIHADAELLVESGKIEIAKCYEGLEAQKITINGGDISIKSSDDGINAAGGSDSSAMNRLGAGAFDTDIDAAIIINDGNIYINASGDGVDSNGSIYFNGGSVIVDGPTVANNGALDCGISIYMNGGSVIAIGASGMAENLGSESAVLNASIFFSDTKKANVLIEIKDKSGNTIISHKSAKTFSHIAFGSDKFKTGESYSIYLDGSLYKTITFSSNQIVDGQTSSNGMQGMPGENMSNPGMPGQQNQQRNMR